MIKLTVCCESNTAAVNDGIERLFALDDGSAVELLDVDARSPFIEFFLPGLFDQTCRSDDEAPFDLFLSEQSSEETRDLNGLAETHVVSQNTT